MGYSTLQVSDKTSGEARNVGVIWAKILQKLQDSSILQCLDLLQEIGFKKENISKLESLKEDYDNGKPILLLSGGETTVKVICNCIKSTTSRSKIKLVMRLNSFYNFKVTGKGLGGRNQELVLSFANQASQLLLNGR